MVIGPPSNWLRSLLCKVVCVSRSPFGRLLRIVSTCIALTLIAIPAKAGGVDADEEARLSDAQRREILGSDDGLLGRNASRYVQGVLLPTGLVIVVIYLLRSRSVT